MTGDESGGSGAVLEGVQHLQVAAEEEVVRIVEMVFEKALSNVTMETNVQVTAATSTAKQN